MHAEQESEALGDDQDLEAGAAEPEAAAKADWTILVVDDQDSFHQLTKRSLEELSLEGRGVEILGAHSVAEAKQVLRQNRQIALILLDVVMETEDAGLRLVEYVRNQLENHQVRIILYTGNPDQALEHDIIVDYDINDYKVKSQITPSRLFTAVISALRSYRDILAVEEQIRRRFADRERARRDEARILEITNAISSELHLDELLEKIIAAASEILNAERSSLFLYDPETHELMSRVAEGLTTKEIRFPAAAGLAGSCFSTGETLHIPDAYADHRFNPEFDRETGFRTRNILCMPVRTKQGKGLGVVQVLNKKGGGFDTVDEARLRAFCAQVAIALENSQLFEDVLNARNYNESILKSLSNGVVTVDTDGHIIKANQAAARILGWGREAPSNATVGNVFHQPNDWVAASIDKVAASGQLDLIVDSELVLEDGGTVSVNMTSVPLIDVKEQPIGCMLIFEDISAEKRVKSTMSRYMSRELVDQLMQAGEAALGGTAQQATILFSDIRRFTSISEQLGARGTVSVLNEYFTDMVEIVFRHHGILDKYIGDAIMAVFGTPFVSELDAEHAVTVANEMIVAVREFNRRREPAGGPPFEIGVGVAKGEVVAGNIGSLRRMDYTVIGDSVNLAARLEGANKLYKTAVLVGENVKAALQGPARLRELDLIRVKGQDRALAIFEALDHHDEETFPNMEPVLEAFALGLGEYRGGNWRAAGAAFEAALAEHPNDGPSELYLQRCRQFAANPPADDWDGVWTMETK